MSNVIESSKTSFSIEEAIRTAILKRAREIAEEESNNAAERIKNRLASEVGSIAVMVASRINERSTYGSSEIVIAVRRKE